MDELWMHAYFELIQLLSCPIDQEDSVSHDENQ